ncbi:MAG: hypothetical protein WAU36_18980 [Cyclobacteriaceae bacterium]
MDNSKEIYYCNDCYEVITVNVHKYSMRNYGLPLCMNHQQDHPTEGEEIISEFFKEKGIKFKRGSKKLPLKLEEDVKSYRVPDFYLPKYKLYVEFFGQWNVQEHRTRYIEKKKAYDKNRIPCVYLYPENLAMLDQIFIIRAENELKVHAMKKELVKFKLWQFESDFSLAFFHLLGSTILCYIMLALDLSRTNETFHTVGTVIQLMAFFYWAIVVFAIMIGAPYDLINLVISYLKKDKLVKT